MIASPPDTTALRAVLDSVFAGPAYRWVEEPGFVTTFREWRHRLVEWLQDLQTGNPLAFRIFLIALVLVLVAVFAHAAFVAYRTVRGAMWRAEPAGPRPTIVARDAAWYWRAADHAAAEGRSLEALQLAFAGLAFTLDAQGLLRYHPSMTPAECVAAARLTDADRVRLRRLVGTLYAHVFGGRPCVAGDYARWRSASASPWHAATP